ncbi:hypothetical protein SAMN05660337_1490 [Maridesulfovibrio ferrireducens]|uniref:Uncharacterized protein n=1 Tax=Maridesulfovibrio ferrireducens TaxID=246191 RepID=A0A1G9FD04_9BACT|nr:hypothetical protein [Maridesulfovibrio ferrireducens]SDK86252.1 hypothetical protein SAMN05660337_1490 [Maridesulfovibrio ferrireducens]
MIQSKVDSRFLGSVKNSFFVFPTLPPLVKMFLWFIALGVAISIIILLWRKYKPVSFLQAWFKSFPPLRVAILRSKKGGEAVTEEGKSPAVKGPWKISTDKDVLDWLVMTKQPFDISAERLGQRTLAAVVNVTGIQGRDIAVKVKDVVTESLLAPGAKVKCIFAELQRNGKKVNAFVGSVKTVSESGEAVVTRTSAFGFIKRRAFSRRKVADQRYIKVKIWRLDGDDFDVDFVLDNMEPEIIIDNRMDVDAELKVPQILDISKGGIALLGAVRDGGNMLSRNDNVLLCMLIYQPKRKTFDPHILYCEVRAAKSASEGMIRLSFQFLRSLKIPPRKRSTLFRGQAVMAMNLAQPEKE